MSFLTDGLILIGITFLVFYVYGEKILTNVSNQIINIINSTVKGTATTITDTIKTETTDTVKNILNTLGIKT